MIKSAEYRLGQLCKRFSSGKGISAELISNEGEYPVIGGNGLRGFTDTFNFDGECAVIGRQGAYCGNVKFFSGKGYMTEHAVVAEPTDEHNAKYMTYKLGGLQLGRFSGQAAQPGLSVTKLARLRIEMPPKWYRDKVAFILSSYDNLIEVPKVDELGRMGREEHLRARIRDLFDDAVELPARLGMQIEFGFVYEDGRLIAEFQL